MTGAAAECPPRLSAPTSALMRTLILALAAMAAACAPESGTSVGSGAGARDADTRPQVDLLILGGTIVPMDAERTVVARGAVAVDDGVLAAVGPWAEVGNRYRASRTLTLNDHDLVLPGLINAHGHAPMTLLRGVADDLALMDWLEGYIFPAEATLVNADFVRTGTELAALEMIRTGTTTFVDMYYFEEQVARVAVESGLRAVVGQTILDQPAPDHDTADAALAYSRELLEKWSGDPRVTPAVAPHAAYTVGSETLRRCAELAREYGAPLLIHLAESRDEVTRIREDHGTTPVRFLETFGFLGPDVVGAHSIWVEADDRRLLSDRGVGVVHNPESNMKLASGAMPVAALRQAGVAVALGTDGPASNNDLDMFGAMTAAALLAKHASGDPTSLPAEEVLALATIDGARALGMEDRIGSLEAGKQADLIVVDGDAPNLVPRYDPYSHLVYAARGDDVILNMVGGRALYRDGRYQTLDADRIRIAARRAAERVRAVVGGEDS